MRSFTICLYCQCRSRLGCTKYTAYGKPRQTKATMNLQLSESYFRDKIFCWVYLVINPFLNKPWILHVCSRILLKTLWEKEKLLVTSNFSFSSSVFYPLGGLSAINKFFSNLKLASANSSSLEESKIYRFGKD